MNTMKKKGGFTLVELIIVIAILAILSTGAIAGYSRYIQNANNTAVEAVLSDIYTAAVLANADKGAVTVTIEEDGSDLKITVTGVGEKFEDLFEDSLKVGTSAKETSGTTYVGTFAKPSAWDNSKYDGVKVVRPEVETTEPTT